MDNYVATRNRFHKIYDIDIISFQSSSAPNGDPSFSMFTYQPV